MLLHFDKLPYVIQVKSNELNCFGNSEFGQPRFPGACVVCVDSSRLSGEDKSKIVLLEVGRVMEIVEGRRVFAFATSREFKLSNGRGFCVVRSKETMKLEIQWACE